MTVLTRSPWLPIASIASGDIALICFHYAGGAASLYRPWRAHLPEAIELHAVQLPGREGRMTEAPYADIEALMPPLLQVLAPLLARPYALLGYSMGALIAWRLALSIRERRLPAPRHLFVLARSDPGQPPPSPDPRGMNDAEFVEHLRDLGGRPTKSWPSPSCWR